MKLFDVYPLYDIEPVKGEGCYLLDKTGNRYLDFYGGHAVISIGHNHPRFTQKVSEQLQLLPFYSNSVKNKLQQELADCLGELAGLPDYQLFLCNSGAEANENALKLASFHTGKKKIISFSGGFHGRTSLAVALTDNPGIVAPVNQTENALLLPFNDEAALEEAFKQHEIAAVISEGIQGVGGIKLPTISFMKKIASLCQQHGAVFIADSVQCGCGRTGKYFAHSHFEVQADIYTMAKGLGNGFPVGGLLIHPNIKPAYGLLGTTFGGNHLACAAAIAVAQTIQQEKLIKNAALMGQTLKWELSQIRQIKEVRGRGLMLGLEFDFPVKDFRKRLLLEQQIFTGSAATANTLRLLPPLTVSETEVDRLIDGLKKVLSTLKVFS